MTKRHLPSVEALTSSDDDTWITELRMSELREEVARARRLLDALVVSDDGQASSDFVATLARLGCRFVEIAGALSKAKDAASCPDSDRPIGNIDNDLI